MEASDSVDTKQSKQRASIKWLLSKAFNNRVPENLLEPFYRDHEDQEHLKPPILGGLANAELYCRTLANMYSDPNYHSLNHWNILQTLARKGVHVPDPADCALTETVLIQTNPLKMGAHMAVIEALMVLYAREVVTLDRVSAAAQRFGTSQPPRAGAGTPHEDGLLAWINAAAAALNRAEEDSTQHVPMVNNLQELCDGTALAALISFYCPDSLPRSRVRVGRMSSIQDCLHNLMLVQQFCFTCLPHNVFHMMPEDVTYMRGSMRQNLIAMLADLFNLLEVHPVQSVKYPGSERGEGSNEHGVRHRGARCLPPPPPQPIPDLRPDVDAPLQTPFTVPRSPSACAVRPRAPAGRSACSTPERRSCSPQRDQNQFVVHRGRGVTTLSSMARRDDDNVPVDANMTAAGRPSHYGDANNSYAGRRSRRSSISDDSQLTVENFGGSQDRLHFAGRNPEKELATLATARKISAPAVPARTVHTPDPSAPAERSRRSSVSDDSQLTLENFGGHQDGRRQTSARNPEKELAALTAFSTPRLWPGSEPSTPLLEPNGRPTGRRSRRSSISDESQLTLENFGGFQDKLHFAGKNPEKELATLATARQMSTPNGPLDTYNPPLRSSRQDVRGSIQFFHGDFQNGAQDSPRQPIERQNSQPQQQDNYYPIKRQLSSDTITLNKNYFSNKGGGDGGFFLNRDTTDGDAGKMSFADLNKFRNGDQQALQSPFSQSDVEPQIDRRKTTSFSTPPPNTTTWQQQFMQQESQPNGDDNLNSDDGASGGAMAAQLNNIRLKLEEKRRRIEQEKRRMEVAVSRQRQQLGQQAFLQAVTRTKGAKTPAEEAADGRGEVHAPAQEMPLDHPNQTVDTVALEQYQQSIAKMNSNLQDIQSDIARLSTQQSQLQQQQQTQLQQQQQTALQQQQSQLQQQLAALQQQQQLQAKQWAPQQPQPFHQLAQPNIPQLHNQFSSQHNVNRQNPNNFGSTPHIPAAHYQPQYTQYGSDQPQYRDVNYAAPGQFYLHEGQGQPLAQYPREGAGQTVPQPQRRTWAQHAQLHQENTELRGWQLHQQQQQSPQQQQQHQQQQQQQQPHQYQQLEREPPPDRGWNPQGFVLHDRTNQPPAQVHYNKDRYENGHEDREQNHLSYTVITPQQQQHQQQYSHSPPVSSPQRRAKTPQRQPSVETPRRPDSVSLQQLKTPTPTQVPDDMEPQNISFIGSAEEDALRQGITRLNISSGTRTYRIPSPTRPSLTRTSFQQPEPEDDQNEKGFYISFDNEAPKRPKPPLRVKRMSPKKERTPTEYHSPERRSPEPQWNDRLPQDEPPFTVHRTSHLEGQRDNERANDFGRAGDRANEYGRPHEAARLSDAPRQRPAAEPAALVIGEMNPDPPAQMLQNSAEEMERKKERIMLLSLQRRQRAEEARARAEAAAAARKAREEQVQEQKLARKEEQARRREIILQQYKLKKAVEEAEREGKTLDKTEYYESIRAAGGAPPPSQAAPSSGARLRPRAAGGKARPKTIHVDSGALQAAEGLLGSKQPSSTNLTGASTMRRDYYRGSQDSLAERAGLYRDSPVDDRGGMSPSSGSSGPLGRRGSCKTSRERVNDVEPQATRGRSKYTTYQSNFKAGRKSSSLMNLCDSGLGRATPPRRAPSPGVRALASPAASGPGSLPGGIGKRRQHSDDNSDASSQHSSIMDYSGPRLYKQPTTKSNRGIMLNAVEYCVFPGAVNAEAKRRVLEEIARSEAKHFLVLFRDAGCQFRALYSYCPDTEQVVKLYGTGPKNVNDRMFDKFFKYNSGSKCFSQVHTKHLTVTIDAFTIHNSLWQGKKVQLPSKKDMALVI